MAANGMYSTQALRDSFQAPEDYVSYLHGELLQHAGRTLRARPEQAPPTVEDLEAYRRVMEAEAEEDEPAPMPTPVPAPRIFVVPGRRAVGGVNAHGQRLGAYEGPWYDRENKRAVMLANEGCVLYGVFDKVVEELAQKREAADAKGEKVDGNINEGQYKEMLDAAMKLYNIKPRSPQTIIGEFTSLMEELADVENTSVVWNDKTEREVRELVVELWRCNPSAAREAPAPVSTEPLSDTMFHPTTSRDAEGNEWRQILTNRSVTYQRTVPTPPAPRAVMEDRGPAFSQQPPESFDVTAAYRVALNAMRHRAPQAYQTTPPRSEGHSVMIPAEPLAETRQLLRDPPDAPLYTDHAMQIFDSRVQQRVRQRLSFMEQLRRRVEEDRQRMEEIITNRSSEPVSEEVLAARREAYGRAMSGQAHAEQGSNAVADPDTEWRERVQTVPARNPRMIFDETNSDSELIQQLQTENEQAIERMRQGGGRSPRMIFDETNSDSELMQQLLAENQQRMEAAARAED